MQFNFLKKGSVKELNHEDDVHNGSEHECTYYKKIFKRFCIIAGMTACMTLAAIPAYAVTSSSTNAAHASDSNASKKAESKKANSDTAKSEKNDSKETVSEATVSDISSTITQGTGFSKDILNMLPDPTGIYTIAVFGLDSRNGSTAKGALSDVNMLVQINHDNGEIKLVSVYRDTYLQIDEDDIYHKLNQAYHRGGHEQALWALEHNTDIKADDYASFNWKSVVDGINILGGIDLEITDKEFKYINGFITETVNSTGVGSVQLKKPGMQHLDGVQAVAYARLRLMDNDFKRTERQRKVLTLCLEKLQKAAPETLITLAVTVFPQIDTSIEPTSFMPLLKNMGNYKIAESKGWPFENAGKKIKNRGSCVIPATLESNVIELHKFLYPTDDGYEPSEGVKKSSRYIEKVTGVHQKG